MKRAAILGPMVAIFVSLGVVFMSTRKNKAPEAPIEAPAAAPVAAQIGRAHV